MTGVAQNLPIPLPASFGGTGITALGTGVATALGTNVGSAGAPVVQNGALGTPASGTLTSATGLPLSTGISGLGTGIASALAINTGSAGAPVLFNGALGTPTSGDLTATNASIVIGQAGLPFVMMGTATYNNNGAVVLAVALGTTYASGYAYAPANSISASNAAGWYYFTGASTTALTLFNNTYTSGTPTIPGSPTAFVTTGQGAGIAGKATVQAAYSFTVPANIMGLNGGLRVTYETGYTNTAATKVFAITYGGTSFGSFSGTTNVAAGNIWGFKNRGSTAVQVGLMGSGMPSSGASNAAPSYGTVDTTSTQTFNFNLTNGTPATNNMVLEHVVVELLPSVT